ncbi:terminase small subunit [Enterobacter ludwigii]|uniref:terminase small subunit n=1 Tax=Enterobacter ludwigii TaxID=299767 RepID=UPI003BEEB949
MSNRDEKAIERDFCAGVLTLEEVAGKHGITVKALRYLATKKGWKRAKGTRESKGKSGAKKGQKAGAKSSENLPQKMPQNSVDFPPGKSHKIPTEKSHVQEDEPVFNPSDFGLSGQQGEFAEAVALGKTLIEAYGIADYKSEGQSAYVIASQLLRNPKVARAIRWLRDRRQKRLALTEQEIIHQLSSIASADPNLISHIRRVNCRYCWGNDHQYQWRDVDEYEHACASALAESRPPPAFDGGIGFVETTIPNEACPRCSGDGRMDLFFADTSMLDGPERWLVTGVEQTMNGLKVRMASPEAARKELLAYIKATRRVIPGDSNQPATDKESLELKGLELRNEKLQAEIENIRKSKNDSNLVVVHNAMQVPEDSQSDQDESDIEE